jgi:excisionase family DNA binding protein
VTPEELRNAVAAEIAPLLRRLGRAERRLLSKREAARRLGIDRGTTLQDLIRSGEIRTVVLAGRVKIPASEIERLEAGGNNPRSLPAARERAPRARRSTSPGQAIRALKIT